MLCFKSRACRGGGGGGAGLAADAKSRISSKLRGNEETGVLPRGKRQVGHFFGTVKDDTQMKQKV